MHARIPFANVIGVGSPDQSGVLIAGIPGYKISLRGLYVALPPSSTAPASGTLSLSGLATTSAPLGPGPDGSLSIPVAPSATETQYLSLDFPEGCAETIGWPANRMQGPGAQPYSISYALSSGFTANINFWGQFMPIPE